MTSNPPDKKISHFSWPDVMVLVGAALIVPVAVFQRNWFFLSIGIALAASIGLRVWLTTWLEKRSKDQ
jgi:ABC-type Fe3+-siderophore transport system permease subunit